MTLIVCVYSPLCMHKNWSTYVIYNYNQMTQCDASLHFFFHYATTVASVLEVKLVTLNDSMVSRFPLLTLSFFKLIHHIQSNNSAMMHSLRCNMNLNQKKFIIWMFLRKNIFITTTVITSGCIHLYISSLTLEYTHSNRVNFNFLI